MTYKYWYTENYRTPRTRVNPTTVHRRRVCPTCNCGTLQETLCRGNAGRDPFMHDFQPYSWHRIGSNEERSTRVVFERMRHAQEALNAFNAWQAKPSRYDSIVSGTDFTPSGKRATAQLNAALRRGLD